MTPDYSRIWPWIFAVLIPLMIYRRLRRSFGRQPLRPTRMTVRMIILAALGASLAPAALRSTGFLAGEAAGAAFGAALALWGAKRTRFLTQNAQLYYVPHTYAGIAVSLLVVGRIAYRFVQVYSARGFVPAGAGPGDSPVGAAPASMVQSPLTVGIFFVSAIICATTAGCCGNPSTSRQGISRHPRRLRPPLRRRRATSRPASAQPQEGYRLTTLDDEETRCANAVRKRRLIGRAKEPQ
jgi:hypothetical protein